MPHISIVLPIYNVEHYLKRCLDSIFNQKFTDFEVIAVDDGSIDNSLKILESYQLHENRLKIFNKVNEGAGSARNFGINHATGKYIFFVDPDDSLIPDKLVTLAEMTSRYNAELFLFGFEEVDVNNKLVRSVKNKALAIYEKNEDIGKDFVKLSKENNMRVPWNKLYLRETLNQHLIEFPNQKTGEDAVFNFNLFNIVKRIVVIDDVFYRYLIGRPNSSQSSFKKVRLADNLIISKKLSELVEHWGLENNLVYNNDINNGFKVIKDVFASKSIKFIIENIKWFRRQKKFIAAFDAIEIREIREKKQIVKYIATKLVLLNCR